MHTNPLVFTDLLQSRACLTMTEHDGTWMELEWKLRTLPSVSRVPEHRDDHSGCSRANKTAPLQGLATSGNESYLQRLQTNDEQLETERKPLQD